MVSFKWDEKRSKEILAEEIKSQFVVNMLQAKESIEKIVSYSGLSADTIRNIARQNGLAVV